MLNLLCSYQAANNGKVVIRIICTKSPLHIIQNASLTSMHYQILHIVRHNRVISRAQLSDMIGMSRSSIGQYADDLLDLKLLEEGETGEKTGGRRSRLLRFHSDLGSVLSILVGADSLRVGLYNLYSEEITHVIREIDVTSGPLHVLEQIVEIVEESIAKRYDGCLAGVGIGVPGPVNRSAGWVESPPTMPGWHRFPVVSWLKEKFGCEVVIENDVNCMALGEKVAGLGRRRSDFVFVGIGHGIGAGIISGGKLHRGINGCAGELGHIQVASGGRLCLCGRTDCLETIASGSAMADIAAQKGQQNPDSPLGKILARDRQIRVEEVAILATQGDEDASEIIRSAGEHLGKALTTVITTLNPESVILGGDILTIVGDLFLASFRETIYRSTLPLATRDLRIQCSQLTRTGGMIGACSLLVDQLLHSSIGEFQRCGLTNSASS